MKSLNQIQRNPITWIHFFLFTGLISLLAFNWSFDKDQKVVSVALDKMNVLYIGVDNPLTVAVEGISDDKVSVASDDVQLTKISQGRYNVIAKKPGITNIRVYGKGFEMQSLPFRVKYVPDPIAILTNQRLNLKTGGTVPSEEFKKAEGLALLHDGCIDFDVKMSVSNFSLFMVPPKGDVIEVICDNGKINTKAQQLIQEASPGFIYYFENVKAKVEGDAIARKLNSLVFKIE